MTAGPVPSFSEWVIGVSFAVIPAVASVYFLWVWRRKHDRGLRIQHFLILSILSVFILRKLVTLALYAMVAFRIESSPFCAVHDVAIYSLKFLHYVYVLLFSVQLAKLTKSRCARKVVKFISCGESQQTSYTCICMLLSCIFSCALWLPNPSWPDGVCSTTRPIFEQAGVMQSALLKRYIFIAISLWLASLVFTINAVWYLSHLNSSRKKDRIRLALKFLPMPIIFLVPGELHTWLNGLRMGGTLTYWLRDGYGVVVVLYLLAGCSDFRKRLCAICGEDKIKDERSVSLLKHAWTPSSENTTETDNSTV